MQVYHATVKVEDRHEVDPRTGRIERVRDEYLTPSSLASIHPAGTDTTYEKGPNGAFEVPEEVGRVLLGKQGWFAGAPPVRESAPASVPEVVQIIKPPVKAMPEPEPKVEAPKPAARRGRPPGSKNTAAAAK
jgi:hypothetical protein